MRRFLLIASMLTLLAPTRVGAETVAGWTVGPWDSDGRYIGCAMHADFTGGNTVGSTTVGVLIKAEGGWFLFLKNNSWSVREGSKLRIQLLVDNVVVHSGTADVLAGQLVSMSFDGSHATYEALRAGRVMEVVTDAGRTGRYNLDGTRAAMNAVLQCAANNEHRRNETARAPTPAPAQGGGTNAVPIPAVEAMAMLTNMLAMSGATGYRIETPTDNTIAWTAADGARGMFFGFRNYVGKPEEAVSEIYRGAAESCKGEVATVKKSVPTDDGSIVRKIAIGCRTSGQVTQTSFITIQRQGGVLLVIAYGGGGGAANGGSSGDGSTRGIPPVEAAESSLVNAALRLQIP